LQVYSSTKQKHAQCSQPQCGFADSKQLSAEKREALFAKILHHKVGFKTAPLSAEMLSAAMLRVQKYNLNDISHDTAIQLIRDALNKGVNVTEVFVDTVGPPAKYQTKLQRQFPNISITVAKRADSTFPVVSAASICAKVIRDRILRTWDFEEKDIDCSRRFGSGYPSDPRTVAWLNRSLEPVFGFPSVTRFSWQTVDTLLAKDGVVEVQWEIESDEENDWQQPKKRRRRVSKIGSDEMQSPLPSAAASRRFRFFADRALVLVSEFMDSV